VWEADNPEVGTGESNGHVEPREALLDLEDLPFAEIIGISSPLAIKISLRGYPPADHMDGGVFFLHIVCMMGLLPIGCHVP
jgi:hypothetical protein